MKNIFKICFVSLLYLLLSLAFAQEGGNFTFFRVKNKGANVRESASFQSKKIVKLRPNRIVQILERSDSFQYVSGTKIYWYKVLTMNNREGFIYGEELESAKPERLKKRDFSRCVDCPEYDMIGMENYFLNLYPKLFQREGNTLILNLQNGTAKKFVSTMDDGPENNLGFGGEGEAYRLIKYSSDFLYAAVGINDGGEEGSLVCIDIRTGSTSSCDGNQEVYFSPDSKKVLKLGITGEGPSGVYYILIHNLGSSKKDSNYLLKTKSHEFYKIPHDLLVNWKTSKRISVLREIPYNDTSAIYSYSELVYRNKKWIYLE